MSVNIRNNMRNKAEHYEVNPMDEVIIEIAQIRSEIDVIANAITDLAQKGISYTLPDTEIRKISRYVAGMASEAVARTQCAPPDMSDTEHRMSLTMGDLARDKVAQLLSTIEVNHTHTVNHVLTKEVKDLVDRRLILARRWLAAVVVVLSLAIGINSAIYFSSEMYWGHRLWEITGSEYQSNKSLRESHTLSYEKVHIAFAASAKDRALAKDKIREWGRELNGIKKDCRKSQSE